MASYLHVRTALTQAVGTDDKAPSVVAQPALAPVSGRLGEWRSVLKGANDDGLPWRRRPLNRWDSAAVNSDQDRPRVCIDGLIAAAPSGV